MLTFLRLVLKYCSMPETSKPVDQLRALHKEDDSDELKRPDILVTEKVEAVREIVVALLKRIFPGYNILATSDVAKARDKISQELRDSLALVFADTEDFDAVSGLLLDLRKSKEDGRIVDHGKKVPVIFTSASIPPDKGPVLEKALENGTLDGFIPKPFAPDSLSAVLSDSIAKRAGLFEEIEEAARGRVLGDFIEYYNSLAQAWETNLQPLAATATGIMKEDFDHLLGGVASFKAKLATMRVDINYQELRRLIHDFNNVLSVLITFPQFILEAEVAGSAKEFLAIFNAEVQKLRSDIELIAQAIRGDISWTSADQPKLTPEAEQVLRCPEGTRFCVVDDNENVRKVCERVIRDAGGNLVATITDGYDISPLVSGGPPYPHVDVFLLDHELGGKLYGHGLIGKIRAAYPHALIICHTGEAAALNADPENPYRIAGIEVVGKREWNAVSGIIRRKFTSAEEV